MLGTTIFLFLNFFKKILKKFRNRNKVKKLIKLKVVVFWSKMHKSHRSVREYFTSGKIVYFEILVMWLYEYCQISTTTNFICGK